LLPLLSLQAQKLLLFKHASEAGLMVRLHTHGLGNSLLWLSVSEPEASLAKFFLKIDFS
jgi:hypothetical protein